ncbi:hypothetical protein EMPS_00277 [Entomortierella parvispora]|uniref:Uncharacterized protein n=1 Tax=Entomortierella parvispora TaxID=205924 RepID=A0A9P3LR65_9FUNG|nr:hypothetical protein EMPS_00277 [Entomortierella parvispora]
MESPASPASSHSGSHHENEDHDESIDVPPVILIQLHLRKGQPLVRCRSTKDLPNPAPFQYNIKEESFDHLIHLIRTHLPEVPGRDWPEDARPYLQPAHTTPQKKYREMSEENYRPRMEKAWRVSYKRVSKEMLRDPVCVHLFIYLVSANAELRKVKTPITTLAALAAISNEASSSSSSAASASAVPAKTQASPPATAGKKVVAALPTARKIANGTTGDATPSAIPPTPEPSKARLDEAHALIADAVSQKRLDPMGAITESHFARYLASLPSFPSPTEILVLPQTDLFREAKQLDAMARTLQEKRRNEEALEREPYRTVRMKLNGADVPVQIHLQSLKEALGLL